MMEELTGPPANPSSVHFFGARAKKNLQSARRTVADFFQVKPEEIIFTSGGTESINLMLRGLPKGHLITTDLEHSAVYKTLQTLDSEITYLSPKLYGAATKDLVESAIRPDTKAIILCAANNETGVKIDIPAIATLALHHKIPLFLDAVSYIGKEQFPMHPGISAIALSGHKFHAPKGIGALILRTSVNLKSTLTGGNQESLHRAGTENLAGVIGLAAALQILAENQAGITAHLLSMQTHFETELITAIPDLIINGAGPRLPNTTNLTIPNCDGETLLVQLDLAGIATSLGSACSSGALEPSRVLLNMGLTRKAARSSLRFSFSRQTTLEEIDTALSILIPLIQKLQVLAR
jgi:cysteine desulfurase